jgi:type IV secretory pathway protease TraF
MKRINGFILMLILLLTLFMILGMACNRSPSAPRGLYRLIAETPQRGQYVVLAMPLKRVAGMPGDIVRVTPRGSYINGHLVPNSAPVPPDHFPYGTYVLGPYELWLLGQDPMSWDARYYGPTPITLVNAVAQPIWIEHTTPPPPCSALSIAH